MKLIISATPFDAATISVVNGDDVIASKRVFGPQIKESIDEAFSNYYIEAVQMVEHTVYTQKFVDYIEEKYKNVEVI